MVQPLQAPPPLFLVTLPHLCTSLLTLCIWLFLCQKPCRCHYEVCIFRPLSPCLPNSLSVSAFGQLLELPIFPALPLSAPNSFPCLVIDSSWIFRFGHQLRTSLIKDWEWHYIDYDRLKDLLRPSSKSEWSDNDEQRFLKELESELDKVFTFQKVKSQEIIQRIKAAEAEVNLVISRADSRHRDAPTEDDYFLLEDDLSEIIADVHDLAKFTQLNYTGFYKIIKKHDKQTKWQLKPVFATRLKAKPFFKDNYDAFIIKLSRLYDLVRTRGHPVKGDSAAGGGQQNFVRQTTKYWVHPDNITELKLIILKVRLVILFYRTKLTTVSIFPF